MLAILGLLGIVSPARADDVPPSPSAPAPATRVLALPGSLDAEGMLELAAELRLAGRSAVVLVHGPAPARISGPVADDVLLALASAARDVQLDVLVEPGEAGDAAAFVSAFGDRVFVLPGAELGALRDPDLRRRVLDLTGCQPPCVAVERVADGDELQSKLGDGIVLDGKLAAGSLPEEKPEPGGGVSPLLLAVPAIVILGLSIGLVAGRRRPPAERPAPPRETPRAPSRPKARPRRRPALPLDPSLPSSGHALVRSELHPDGYVELEGCLRRARWSNPASEPPATGEWVRVESQGGRLVAHRGRPR